MDHNLISRGMFSDDEGDQVLELWFALVDNGLEDNLWSRLNLFVTALLELPHIARVVPSTPLVWQFLQRLFHTYSASGGPHSNWVIVPDQRFGRIS